MGCSVWGRWGGWLAAKLVAGRGWDDFWWITKEAPRWACLAASLKWLWGAGSLPDPPSPAPPSPHPPTPAKMLHTQHRPSHKFTRCPCSSSPTKRAILPSQTALFALCHPPHPTEMLHTKYGLSAYAASRLSPYDRHYAPSALLLRDVFLGLLRAVEGRLEPSAAAGGPGQPKSAKLALPEAEVGWWWCFRWRGWVVVGGGVGGWRVGALGWGVWGGGGAGMSACVCMHTCVCVCVCVCVPHSWGGRSVEERAPRSKRRAK